MTARLAAAGMAYALSTGSAPDRAFAQDAAGTPPGALRTVRPIAPELVAPPLVLPDQLQRSEPRAPLSAIGPAGPLPPKPRKKAALIHRPVAVAAGRLEGGGVTVNIEGLDIVEPEATCTRFDGAEWPCGAVARTAFRSFLRGRAVDCSVPPDDPATEFTRPCHVAGTDLGNWLVSAGWARAAPGGPFEAVQQRAAAQGRGIHGDGPGALPAPREDAPTSALPSPADLLVPENSAPIQGGSDQGAGLGNAVEGGE